MTQVFAARSCVLPLVVLALMPMWRSQRVLGQSLHGSRASINRMYRHARNERLTFLRTSRSVRKAVHAHKLVRLMPGPTYELHDVSYPYVQPSTRTFVQRLAAEYVAACGSPLVVTSAVRPESRQPDNSVARSVHPTGMAIDLRKPRVPKCLHWMRSTLMELEDAGVIEATEEFSPPHFHVAVYPTPYKRYIAKRESTADTNVASR